MLMLAVCHMKTKQLEQAVERAEEVIKLNRNNAKAHFLKAECNYQLGNFEHGLLHFHKASALRPAVLEYKQGVNKCQRAIENVIGGELNTLKCFMSRKKRAVFKT